MSNIAMIINKPWLVLNLIFKIITDQKMRKSKLKTIISG